MLIFDIETIPNELAITSRQWQEHKTKKGIESDQDAALHPAFGQVVCVCMYREESKAKFKLCTDDEKDLLGKVQFFMQNELLAGHFIKGFDIPFLACRYMAHGMEIPKALNCAGKKPWEIPHIDTVEVLKFGGNNHISLDAACLMLGIDSPKEGAVSAMGVRDAFREGRFDDIMNYCSADVQATIKLINVLRRMGAIK